MEYYPRKIEENLRKWIKRKEIIIIKGPRQSGKTTLLLHLKEKFGGEYITLEDEEMLESFENSPKKFIKRFLKNQRNVLYIDEAQYSKKVGKLLKILFDLYSEKIKLIVTGSGSFDVKVEIGKYLVGRAIYFELLPLDFEEFIMWKAKDLLDVYIDYKNFVISFIQGKDASFPEIAYRKEFRNLMEEYITYGGFPQIVKEEDYEIKKELLKNLVKTYLEKDVFFFFNIRHLEKFRNTLKYLSFNSGSVLEISSMCNALKLDYKTIENYISVLVNTYILFLLSPFHKNLATELRKSKKIYFLDSGMRNALLNNYLPLDSRTDKGSMLEHFILRELIALTQSFENIYYWRTTGKAEVDFVLNIKNEIIPIEVKSHGKIGKSFRSFLSAYKPKRAVVFCEECFGIKEIGKTKVAFLPHFFI